MEYRRPGLVSRITRRLASEVRTKLGREPEWRNRKRVVDREFDAAQGVDTGGITHLKDLRLNSPSWRDGVDYIAADPAEFAAAIESLDLDLSRFAFIDLGSGKGRALLLANDYPFQEIIGVEFAEPLVQAARDNIAKISRSRDVGRIKVIHADALEYDLPDLPSIVFLYNPFGSSTMQGVAKHTRQSLLAAPRDLVILYLNPFQLDAWLQAGFERVGRGPHFSVIKLPPGSS